MSSLVFHMFSLVYHLLSKIKCGDHLCGRLSFDGLVFFRRKEGRWGRADHHELAFLIQLSDKRDELDALHPRTKCRGHDKALRGLPVLEDATERAFSSSEGGVEKVTVRFLLLGALLRGATANLKAAGLKVGAVGAGNELAPCLRGRKPRLEIVLLRRGVVQLAGNDVDDLVRDAEALVECLGVANHALHLLPALIAVRAHCDKLLNLLELVHTEDTQGVATVRSSLLAKACGVAREANGQLLGLDPSLTEERAARLLRGGDEVLVLLVITLTHLVQLLIEIRQLRTLRHAILTHEERGAERGVSASGEEGERVVDERLVEEHAGACEEVAAASCDVGAVLGVGDVEHDDEVHVVGQLFLHALGVQTEGADDRVVLLVLTNDDRVVHDVSDSLQERVHSLFGVLLLLLELDAAGGEFLDLSDRLIRVFFGNLEL
mmetsp:Transcript_14824/g.64165  ORF Transcript_14824/g.64165 Transcript_14824/m.64165 type:complete len:434 (-) Transcript_14824:246-1547(-)